MISTTYLHEHDTFDNFMEEVHHIMNDVYDARNRLIAAENYIDEQVFMGESVEDYQVMLEETKKNVFAKIGDAVKKFFQTLIETMKKFGEQIGDSIKSIKKHMSSSDEALKEQMKNDPELAQKFINSVMSGNIKVHDVKDMDDLLKTAQDLTKQLSSGKIDEKTYMDKVDEKLEKYAKRAKAITAILGVVIGTTGIFTAVEKLRVKSAKLQEEQIKARENLNATCELAMREANEEAGGQTNRLSVWLKGQQKIAAAYSLDYSGWRGTVAKAEGWLGNLVGKINTGYNRKNNDAPLERVKRRQEDADRELERTERIRQSVIDSVKREAEDRAERRQLEKEKRDNQRQLEKERRDDERQAKRDAKAGDQAYNQSYNQRKGQIQADHDFMDTLSDNEHKKSYFQQRGKSDGQTAYNNENPGEVRRNAFQQQLGRNDANRWWNRKYGKKSDNNNP